MQAIQGILLGVCFAGALGGIVHLLSPGGSTDRLLRFAVALFVLAAAAVPLRAVRTAFSASSVQVQKDTAVDAVLHNVEEAIEQTARTVLDARGCTDASISVSAEVKDGEVHTASFIIAGVPQEQSQEIADEIYRLTGEMPQMEAGAQDAFGE